MFDLLDEGTNTIPNQIFKIYWSYVSFEKQEYYANENDDNYLAVTLLRRGDTSLTSFVSMELHNKTAKTNLDVAHKINSQVQFDIGDIKKTWRVKIIKDDVFEGDEKIGVSMSNPHNTLIEKPKRADVVIRDDKDQSLMFFTDKQIKVRESVGMVKLKIKRTGDLSKISSVVCYTETIDQSDNQAHLIAQPTGPSPLESHKDYIHRPRKFSSTIQFQENEQEKECEVYIIDDSLYEQEEKFLVKLADAWTGNIDAAKNTVEVSILPDPKDIPMFYFDTDEFTVDESGKFLDVRIWRNGADLNKESSVTFATSMIRDRTQLPFKYANDTTVGLAENQVDYTGVYKVVKFPRNTTMQTVQIRIIDDYHNVRLEGREIFKILLTKAKNGVLGKLKVSYVIIDDSESDKPTIAFKRARVDFTETDQEYKALIERSGDVTAGASVRCFTRQGTAKVQEDFTELPNTTDSVINFLPNEKRAYWERVKNLFTE